MKCLRCNSDLQAHWNYCPHCGIQVNKSNIKVETDYDPGSYPDDFNPVLWNLEG